MEMQCKSMGALWEVLFQDTSADSSGSLYDKNYTKKDNCQHSVLWWGEKTSPCVCSWHYTIAICTAGDWNGHRICFYVAFMLTEQFSDHYQCLEDLKILSLQKRPLPSGWTWSLIMAFSGIYFIPLGVNGHKIPPTPPPGTDTEWDVYHGKVYNPDVFWQGGSGEESNGMC